MIVSFLNFLWLSSSMVMNMVALKVEQTIRTKGFLTY